MCWNFSGDPVVKMVLPKQVRLCAPNAGDTGSIPGRGTKILHNSSAQQINNIKIYIYIEKSGRMFRFSVAAESGRCSSKRSDWREFNAGLRFTGGWMGQCWA